MAHDIWSGKFYNSRTVPAWHGINILNELNLPAGDYTARDVWERMFGRPEIAVIPQQFVWNGLTLTSDQCVIVRQPVGEETRPQVFGYVDVNYEMIDYNAIIHIYDSRVTRPVDTMGLLRKGEVLFISTSLPAIGVKGEQVDMYLNLVAPMNGRAAVHGIATPVRTVCQNTLNMAEANAQQRFAIRHTPGAGERLGNWLERTYANALMAREVMQEALELLANKPAALPDIHWIAQRVYPTPKRPNPDTPRRTPFPDVLREYEYRLNWVSRAQTTIADLFQGKMTGFDSEAVRGTLYGAFNAVSEFATYRRGTSESMALNALTGDRNREILKAYELCKELAAK